MDPILRERMGNATSLFNLMRNLGGSVGVAATSTTLSRRGQEYINIFGSHIDPYSPAVQARLESARQAFMAAGADPATAAKRRRRCSAPSSSKRQLSPSCTSSGHSGSSSSCSCR